MMFYADDAQHDIATEEDANIIYFNIVRANKRLILLGCSNTQSVNILIFQQLPRDKKTWSCSPLVTMI